MLNNHVLTAPRNDFWQKVLSTRTEELCLIAALSCFTEPSTGKHSDCIYLDYAKAFDKVDYELLMHTFQCGGIKGKLVDWTESFLSDHTVIGYHKPGCLLVRAIGKIRGK